MPTIISGDKKDVAISSQEKYALLQYCENQQHRVRNQSDHEVLHNARKKSFYDVRVSPNGHPDVLVWEFKYHREEQSGVTVRQVREIQVHGPDGQCKVVRAGSNDVSELLNTGKTFMPLGAVQAWPLYIACVQHDGSDEVLLAWRLHYMNGSIDDLYSSTEPRRLHCLKADTDHVFTSSEPPREDLMEAIMRKGIVRSSEWMNVLDSINEYSRVTFDVGDPDYPEIIVASENSLEGNAVMGKVLEKLTTSHETAAGLECNVDNKAELITNECTSRETVSSTLAQSASKERPIETNHGSVEKVTHIGLDCSMGDKEDPERIEITIASENSFGGNVVMEKVTEEALEKHTPHEIDVGFECVVGNMDEPNMDESTSQEVASSSCVQSERRLETKKVPLEKEHHKDMECNISDNSVVCTNDSISAGAQHVKQERTLDISEVAVEIPLTTQTHDGALESSCDRKDEVCIHDAVIEDMSSSSCAQIAKQLVSLEIANASPTEVSMRKAATSKARALAQGQSFGVVAQGSLMVGGAGAGGGFGLNAPTFGVKVKHFAGGGSEVKAKRQVDIDADIGRMWAQVLDDDSKASWVFCKYANNLKKLELQASGESGLSEFKTHIGDYVGWGAFRCYGVDKRGSTETRRTKFLFVKVAPESASTISKAKQSAHIGDVKAVFTNTHLDVVAESVADLEEQALITKLQAAAGAHKPNGYEFDIGNFIEADFYGLGIGSDCKSETVH